LSWFGNLRSWLGAEAAVLAADAQNEFARLALPAKRKNDRWENAHSCTIERKKQ
jgi:hypothetical protein